MANSGANAASPYRELALHMRSVPCNGLQSAKRQTRRHPEGQIATLTATIQRFGFLVPILIDAENRIVAGHARVEAAKRLGYAAVPAIVIDHLSENQRRALAIADNRVAELAEWDEPALKLEFEVLAMDADEFLIEATCFQLPEIEMITLGAGREAEASDPMDAAPAAQAQAVSQPGDLWLLGDEQQHHLLCADATKSESYRLLMGEEKARLAFTDPPYNVRLPAMSRASVRSGTASS